MGWQERKHVQADDIILIGKEANNIEEQPMEVTLPQVFKNKKEIMEKILALPQKEAEKAGVERGAFKKIKDKIRETGDIRLNTSARKRLVDYRMVR